MPYRLKPNVPLALIKDREGRLNYHYAHNAVIPWISDEQLEHLLRNGIVEEVDESFQPHPVGGDETKKPAKTAAPKAWVDYGVAQGHDRGELEALEKPDLIELLG